MLVMVLISSPVTAEGKGAQGKEEILGYIEGIINWKKKSMGIELDAPLLNNSFLQNAGDTTGDWFPLGIGRAGYPDEYESYLAVIGDVVKKRYEQPQRLSDLKATEWHRISLAILAMGGDPTNIGTDENVNSINLIADGTYNRGKTETLGKQGINGWIWGLIALDSLRYTVPEDADYTRADIIQEIIKNQLADGGFALNGEVSDPDMTAMAIQALAPYYNSEELFTYGTRDGKGTIEKAVRAVIDEALAALSDLQLPDGDFASWETSNAESTAQVLVALTALGIDPLEDERFIKNSNTVLDGILKYLMDDGGFIHAETYDPDNPSSLPNESNTMASEQVLYSLIAFYRHAEGYRTLYDFREEMTDDLKLAIAELEEAIDMLPPRPTDSHRTLIEDLFTAYVSIPIEERSYVFNYYKLAAAMEELSIENNSEPMTRHIGINKNGNGNIISIFKQGDVERSTDLFSGRDAALVKAIPDDVTTEHYVEVIKLMEKIETANNREEYTYLLEALSAKKEKIEGIEQEISGINQEIIQHLYPFSDISVKDKDKVEEITTRYQALSAYDQAKVQSYIDVEKAETQINNLIRARNITIGIAAAVAGLSMILVIRRRKRKYEKLKQKMLLEEE